MATKGKAVPVTPAPVAGKGWPWPWLSWLPGDAAGVECPGCDEYVPLGDMARHGGECVPLAELLGISCPVCATVGPVRDGIIHRHYTCPAVGPVDSDVNRRLAWLGHGMDTGQTICPGCRDVVLGAEVVEHARGCGRLGALAAMPVTGGA